MNSAFNIKASIEFYDSLYLSIKHQQNSFFIH